ncbi:MAG: helix-turn-helix transcriptional regulator [Armatimonadetes bacterium]|nr:helix-turn-helix transcriptional regulator [Armatimonadota bacterium]
MSPEQVCELLDVLSDPVRLRLLALLRAHGTLCVCELEEVTGVAHYTVSRSLGILRRAGLVAAERDGVRMDYRLVAALSTGVTELLDRALALCLDHSQLLSDSAAAERLRAGCCPAAV